jgi:hypothetical protein
MPTLEEVKEQFKAANVTDTYGTKKEINELPKVLANDENIKYATSGFLNGSTWLITCTNKRILFLDKGMLYGLKQVDIPLEKVNSISYSTGLVLGKIEVWDGASKMVIENVSKATVNVFVDVVNKAREELNSNKNNSTNGSSSGQDVVTQLEKLASLREKGILTDAEFQKQKAKILNM